MPGGGADGFPLLVGIFRTSAPPAGPAGPGFFFFCWAYFVRGGCSDDGVDYFRFVLCARGRDIFYAALENADSLCDVFGRLSNPSGSEYPQQEELDYAVMNVLEEVYGKDFDEEAARYEWPADVLPHLDFQWEEDDEESIHRVCPRTYDRWWGDDPY